MSKQEMVSQITARWTQLGVPFQAGQGTDLAIFKEFVDAQWRTGGKKIVYEASVYFDETVQTVFMWEKTLETGGGLSGGFDSGSSFQSGKSLFRKIKSVQYGPDGRAYEYELDLGAIQKIVKETAGLYGWKFKIVISKAKAIYPMGYQAPITPAPVLLQAAFCPKCGSTLRAESRFCGSCGQPVPSAAAVPAQSYYGSQNPAVSGRPVKSKKPLVFGLSAVVIVVIAVVIIAGLINANAKKNNTATTTRQTTSSDSQGTVATVPTEDSSILSKGVNLDDLGNIMNGQYFFDDGNQQFYSSFDESSAAHIYVKDKSTNKTKAIFDGFGWSLTIYDGWLYFSGNQGASIDGTYNLFRIRPDGSEVEKINDAYCFGMSVYKNYLYYIAKTDMTSDTYSVCRSKLDGSGEEILVADFSGYCIIYENYLYYAGSDGTLYKANPDSTDAVALINANVRQFIIGNGKMIFADFSGNIFVADIDGQNSNLIRSAGSLPLYSLNSSKDVIYYTLLDQSQPKDQYAYAYELHRVGFDGRDDQLIYSSASYGTFINIVSDHVFVLDYATDVSTGILSAIAYEMGIDGSGVSALSR